MVIFSKKPDFSTFFSTFGMDYSQKLSTKKSPYARAFSSYPRFFPHYPHFQGLHKKFFCHPPSNNRFVDFVKIPPDTFFLLTKELCMLFLHCQTICAKKDSAPPVRTLLLSVLQIEHPGTDRRHRNTDITGNDPLFFSGSLPEACPVCGENFCQLLIVPHIGDSQHPHRQ